MKLMKIDIFLYFQNKDGNGIRAAQNFFAMLVKTVGDKKIEGHFPSKEKIMHHASSLSIPKQLRGLALWLVIAPSANLEPV